MHLNEIKKKREIYNNKYVMIGTNSLNHNHRYVMNIFWNKKKHEL